MQADYLELPRSIWQKQPQKQPQKQLQNQLQKQLQKQLQIQIQIQTTPNITPLCVCNDTNLLQGQTEFTSARRAVWGSRWNSWLWF